MDIVKGIPYINGVEHTLNFPGKKQNSYCSHGSHDAHQSGSCPRRKLQRVQLPVR